MSIASLQSSHLDSSCSLNRLFSACTKLEGLVTGACSSTLQVSRLALQ